MRSVLAVVATVAFTSIGCGDESTAPPPATPAAPPTATPAPTPPPAPVADTTPAAPQKQLMTITTTSPDAKAAFLKSWDLADNGRDAEALDQCKQAVAADPSFAFGHTCVGMETPGAEGQAELDKGAQLAAKLPDAERLFMEGQAALRHHDPATGIADIKKVAELAPDDYHAQLWLGYTLFGQRDFAGARTAFSKALDDNPNAAFLHATLAWTNTQLRAYDDAVTEARKYVDGAPNEGAAHQVLGSMLLNVNQTKDADAELTKAMQLTPKARQVYYDLAAVKTIEGDFAGAHDALDRSQATESIPSQALDRETRTAYALFAEGKNPEAFKALDAAEKDADTRKLAWPADAAIARARAYWLLGKPADAIKTVDTAMPRCDRPESSAAYKADCRRGLLTIEALAQIQAKKVADAQKTVAKLQDEVKGTPGDDWLRVEAEMISDQVAALANKDAKAAAAVLAKCPPDDFLFKLSILRQVQSAGDKATAEQIRKDVLGRPLADPLYPIAAKVAKK